MISLATTNNSSDAVDIGFYGLYDDSGSQDEYAGLFRDASNSRWTFFKDLQVQPTTTVNTSGAGYAQADIDFNMGYGNITGNVTGNADTATALATGRTIE